MSSKLPDKRDREQFGGLFKSMNDFFNERPVKGILQSIDEFFKAPFPLTSFPVDVYETKTEHQITAELPGINKEQIQIDVTGNYLTISINNQEMLTEEDENNHVYRKRVSSQRSSRTIALPQPINEKTVKASYKNGLLQIRIPKLAGKKIQIEE